jgi:hypothetical protein
MKVDSFIKSIQIVVNYVLALILIITRHISTSVARSMLINNKVMVNLGSI